MAIDPIGIALSKSMAIKYGSVGIQSVETVNGTSKIRFNLVDGSTFDCDLSTLSLMWKSTYDTNNNGIVDKSETLKNNTDNTHHDGSFYLDRTNHTGSQDATTVIIDKSGFGANGNNSDFTGTTVQDFVTYLDTHRQYINGIVVGKENTEGAYKLVPENNVLSFYRYQSGAWVKVQSIGSLETNYVVLTNRDSSLTFLHHNKLSKYNGVSLGTLSNSLRVGDTRFENIFLAGDELYKVEEGDAVPNLTSNLGNDVEQSISEFTTEFVADSPDSSVPNVEFVKSLVLHNMDVWCSEVVNGYGVIVTEKATGLEVYRSRSDFEISKCMGTPSLPIGKNTITFPIPIYLRCGETYILTIKADKAYKLKGIIDNSKFYPYLSFTGKWVYYYKVVDEEWAKSNIKLSDAMDSDSSAIGASSKAVNTVRKLITTAVSGMTYMGAVSRDAFVAIDNGDTGHFYILSEDGVIFGKNRKKGTMVIVNTQFTSIPIVEANCDFIEQTQQEGAGIWVTDVKPNTVGKSVSKVMCNVPSQNCVQSITTDDTSLIVTLEWDRGLSDYCTTPSVNGQSVTSYTTKSGGTFTQDVIVDISVTNAILCDNDTNIYSVPITKEVAPVITALTLSQTYPNAQTEVKAGDTMTFNITADKPFTKIEVQGYGCATAKIATVTQGTSANNVQFTVRSTGVTPQAKTIKCRVISPTGSASEWFESASTLTCNDAVPTLAITGYTYPSTQSALKNTEQCTVSYSIDTGCTVAPSVTADLTLGTHNTVAKTVLVTRLSGNYNDSVNNLTLTATKTSNGATTVVGGVVCIAHVAPTLNTIASPFVIRSGDGIITNNVGFSQSVKVTAISVGAGFGNLTSTTTSTFANSYGFAMSSSDTDTKSDTTRTASITVVGMSGLTLSTTIPYKLKGFSIKSFTLTSPSLEATLGTTVVDETKLVVTNGKINSTPPFEIAKRKVSYASLNGELADAWAYNAGKICLPPSVSSFGYGTNTISLMVEETV